jgi:hypothetical protein
VRRASTCSVRALMGVVLERIRFDQARAALLSRYDAVTRQWLRF